MARIRRNDPARSRLHDWLIDPLTGRDVVGFDNVTEAAAYATSHRRALVTVLSIVHPARCPCDPNRQELPPC